MNPLREKLLAALQAQGVSAYEFGYGMGRRCRTAGHPPHPDHHPGVDEQGYHDGYTETDRLA